MSVIKFSEKIIINQMPEMIFDYTQDYSKRLQWDTFLRKAYLLDGAKEASLGVTSYCEAHNRIGLVTEYVSFKRPKVVAIKMINKSLIFKSFLGSWTFKEVENNITEVIFLYSFELNFPFYFAKNFAEKILQNNVKKRLIDLKLNIEKLNFSNV